MGFNKRFVSGRGILYAWEAKQLKGVMHYFEKPDALFIPTDGCFAAEVYDRWNENKLEESFIAEAWEDYSKIYKRIENLKLESAHADDHDTIVFLTDRMMDLEKELSYWTK